ncbi:hypothetical protein ANCCAN_20652 [Ancylostoma caninum]|uniref:Uncharacterized protein n=1 Tax=Ancylostoma caninum TaxID=29170 RepID=A0A368FRQ8_ANCCA|nr:hypothetical protein ANCCAN_20652 [Ancylostoma caninum]
MSLSTRGRGSSLSRHRSQSCRSMSSRRRKSKEVLKSILKNRYDSSCVLSERDLKRSGNSYLHDSSRVNSVSQRRRLSPTYSHHSASTRSRGSKGRSSLRASSAASQRRSRRRSRTRPATTSIKKVRFRLGSIKGRARRSIVWWDKQGRPRDTHGRFVRI